QVHVEIRPLVHKSRAANQTVNHLSALVGRNISHEVENFRRSGNAARKVERDTSKELLVGSLRRVRDAVSFHFPEDVVVDEIASLNPLHGSRWFGQARS